MHYPYTLPELPYDFESLEPYISTLQLNLHYKKHHLAYVENLNKTLENEPSLHNVRLEDILKDLSTVPQSIRQQVINFGGGVYNHAFFWRCLHPSDTYRPSDAFAQAAIAQFGSIEQFKELFSKHANAVFGSGWTWLVLDEKKELKIVNTANQGCPLSEGLFPILCLDLWEHAYYMQYQNRRIEYIEQWWNVVNWHFVQQRYELGMHR